MTGSAPAASLPASFAIARQVWDVPSAEVALEELSSRPGLVQRERLVRLLRAASRRTWTTALVAPGGYGKTSVLAQWARHDGRPFAWVDLDPADNDPVRLLAHLVLAVEQIEPVDPQVRAALAARDASPRSVVVPRLLDWLARSAGDRVLVLDNLHRLRTPASLAVIDGLTARQPPGWHVAVASHRSPDSLGLLRGRRAGLELGPADLAFTLEEAETLLRTTAPPVPRDDVRALLERTEGWPVALYLAAVGHRDPLGETGPAPGPGDTDAELADYFRQEVFERQPTETVSFMIRTSVLRRMSGRLCDAVLETTGSAARLAELQAENVFVVPEDRRGEWFAYHRLFARALLAELRRREPGMERTLHRRAAAWFAAAGDVESAIQHAMASGDAVEAARLVTAAAQALNSTGRLATVERWVGELGDEGIAAYPPLGVTAAWVAAFLGDRTRARRHLASLERTRFEGAPSDGSASLESAVRIVRAALMVDGAAGMLVDAARAVEAEPPGSPWHPVASLLLGVAHLLHDDRATAAKELERAAFLGGPRQYPGILVALSELSALAADRGDWAAAESYAARALETVHRGHLRNYRPAMIAFAVGARVAAQQGRREEAVVNLGNATRLYGGESTPVILPWLLVRTDLVLGRTFLALDDPVAARQKARDARRHLAPLREQGVLGNQVSQLAADVRRRGGPTGSLEAMTLTEAELRVLQLMPTHLSAAEIGTELQITRNTVKFHVAAIYRKLAATTRADAVRRAHELGLLS